MKEDLLRGLNEEQISKVKSCKNQDELLKLAKEEGIELNEEQLQAVSGGGCASTFKCPKCGCTEIDSTHIKQSPQDVGASTRYKCKKCGYIWYN